MPKMEVRPNLLSFFALVIKMPNAGGIEWRSKDGGLSGGTRQKPHQVRV